MNRFEIEEPNEHNADQDFIWPEYVKLIALLSLGLAHGFIFGIPLSWLWQICLFSAGLFICMRSEFSFLSIWAFMTGSFVAGLHWIHFSIHDIGGIPIVFSFMAITLLSSFLAVFPSLFFSLWRRFTMPQKPINFLLLMPGVWTLGELVRGSILTGFPWLMNGYAHIDGPLTGWFPILGVYGVTFFATAISAALVYIALLVFPHSGNSLYHQDPLTDLEGAQAQAPQPHAQKITVQLTLLAIVFFGASFFVKNHVWSQATSQTFSLKAIQPNVEQSLKFSPREANRNISEMFYAAQISLSELTVFPETAVAVEWQSIDPVYTMPLAESLKAAKRNGNDRAVLMGSIFHDEEGYSNSAIWLDGNTDIERPSHYDKIHLLPFGEQIPMGFNWFVESMHIPMSDFKAGASKAPFQLQTKDGPVNIGVNICYENLFGELLGSYWKKGDSHAPQVWVNMSNLGWFGQDSYSPVQSQFIAIARARAMEMARPMIVVTNTGSTAIISALGLVEDALPSDAITTGVWKIQPRSGATPYVGWLNLPMWIVGILCAFWILVFRNINYRMFNRPAENNESPYL